MLLAEALALVTIDPRSGRHATGNRDKLNACLAGLLVAELVLDGAVGAGPQPGTAVVVEPPAAPPVLAAAAGVVAEHGPKLKAIMSSMDRGLRSTLGVGTWDAVVGGLVEEGVLGPAEGRLRTRHDVLDVARRDEIVATLRAAAAGDGPLDARTALLLSMTGPAYLLEEVAPERAGRRHARQRIDGALESDSLQGVTDAVRRVLADAASTVAVVAAATAVAASSS